jgi:hypothetical protein
VPRWDETHHTTASDTSHPSVVAAAIAGIDGSSTPPLIATRVSDAARNGPPTQPAIHADTAEAAGIAGASAAGVTVVSATPTR